MLAGGWRFFENVVPCGGVDFGSEFWRCDEGFLRHGLFFLWTCCPPRMWFHCASLLQFNTLIKTVLVLLDFGMLRFTSAVIVIGLVHICQLSLCFREGFVVSL